MSTDFSHIDKDGKANMVDVSHKPQQTRVAKAQGFIELQSETISKIRENLIKKGDVLTIAEIAGIQAAKQTSTLIPLCHPLPISKVEVNTEIHDSGIMVRSCAKCIGQTGIEMEALTAVSVALLTVYDMCKAIDKKMIIKDIQLVEKIKE